VLSLIHSLVASAHPSAQHTLEVLSESIKARPNEQKLYIKRGSAYSNDGQLKLALADFRKAESLGEPLAVAFRQGVLHYRMKEFEAARGYFDSFLKHVPSHAQSLEYRARLLRDAGEHEAALADFNAYFALQKQPNPGGYVSSAKMLAGLRGEGVSSALAMLDEGMERLGVIPQLQRYAIELELERKNSAGAIIRLETLEPAMGESPDWKVEMGELLLLAGKPAEAQRRFDEASAQLKTLRTTVARQRLLEKLEKLQARLDKSRLDKSS
jgi:tetratricopeptide (TPR) repeat protein